MHTNRFNIVICLFAVSLLISSCGPGQLLGPTVTPPATSTLTPSATPTPSVTPTTTPTATIPPSATSTLTPTPVLLQCTIIKTKFQEYPFNVYALTGEFFPNAGASAPEIEALQVDVMGETGEATRKPKLTSNLSFDYTKLILNLADTRTYSDSDRSYEIQGYIEYNLAGLTISKYNITVSGGIFGTKSQHCQSKT